MTNRKSKGIIASVVLALVLLLSVCVLAACGEDGGNSGNGGNGGNGGTSPETPKPTYTVTFIVDGQTYHSATVIENQAVTFPTDPTKTDYTFAGWYDGETKVTEIGNLTENVTLTAKWKLTEYTVTYILDGGTNSADNPATYTAESGTITLAAPTKAGYAFIGWYDGDSEATEIKSDEKRNITLTAKWQIDPDSTPFEYITASGYEITGLKKGSTATELQVPDYVTSIGASAFMSSSITSVEIPASVVSIGDSAFMLCESLQSVTFAKGSKLESIGREAFYSSSLKSITIPASVTTLGDNLFTYSALEEVTFEDGIQLDTIGYGVFGECALKEIVVPASVTTIGEGAFAGSMSLAEVVFAEGSKLQTVGDYAFGYNTSLKTAELPASVTSIGQMAFYSCTSLESVTFAEGSALSSFGAQAFVACTSLTELYYGGSASEWSGVSGTSDLGVTGVTVYCYSDTQPTSAGNYWHYVGGVATKW